MNRRPQMNDKTQERAAGKPAPEEGEQNEQL